MRADALAELPLPLDKSRGAPLAVQLAEHIRAAATTGKLEAGDRLPSSRALATRLGVSRTVTAAAFEQLHAEGWIAGRHGAGTYVTAAPAATPTTTGSAVDPDVESDLIDLAPGAPWLDGLDRAAWRRAWRAAGDGGLHVRPYRLGVPQYRAAVAEHLLRHRGVTVDSVDVVATAGTSSAVAELAAAVLKPGDVVGVEDPGYGRSAGALRTAGMRVVPIPVDAEGLVVDAIPHDARAVYCTPAHQYPLGSRLQAARRVALVQRARDAGFLVIEDDYDSELRYDTTPLPLLATIDPAVVIHLGTTSKLLTPSLGVGWMVAPPSVSAAVQAHRELTGARPSPAGQLVLAEFARNGDLARHLRRLRRGLAERRALVVETLRAAGHVVVGDEAGGHVVLPLPGLDIERQVIARGAQHGLLLDGLERLHLGTPTTFGIVLGYTACTATELEQALPVVATLVSRCSSSTPASAPTSR